MVDWYSSDLSGVCWSIGDWSSGVLGNNWGSLHDSSILVDDSVESVVWVSGVLNGSGGTIGFNQGVGSLDDVSLTGFVLALVVTGQGVLDVVGVAVK